ncbi:hypothetical protein DCAR_0314113 [Daucus carota subsp. sativus]|uniref:Uncharacterized protein n=1 Tax=Daucus carota subsp. sativus TaxID=79200 RepID=A0AAF1AWB7_DAUCS|nr:hypothetical protein DCAR_0314113 [Daucus carota subsp. sativus]
MERRFSGRERPLKVEFEQESVIVTAMDDIFNLNSVLTFAVFVGLSQASPGARSLENRDDCNAGPGVAKMLIVYEVLAFSFFLFSSLFAKLIKLNLRLQSRRFSFVRAPAFSLKDYMWILTAMTSVIGIVLLMLSVVNLVQIQIGLSIRISNVYYSINLTLSVPSNSLCFFLDTHFNNLIEYNFKFILKFLNKNLNDKFLFRKNNNLYNYILKNIRICVTSLPSIYITGTKEV